MPNTEVDNFLLKMKTSMIVMALERSLGLSVRQDTDGSHAQICGPTGEVVGRSSQRELERSIEKAYLSEIFFLAESAAAGTSRAANLQDLRKYCEAQELYKIRNAVSHPNNAEFFTTFYFRAAAIATHPAISLLRFNLVTEAFDRVMAGVIDEIPSGWTNKYNQKIPSNLPEPFQHDLTSLVGRDKEIRDLLRYILNPRANLIALIAAGGYGKSALILETLRHLSVDPEAYGRFDAILFVSSKTEKLTANGTEKLSAPETIAQLRDELAVLIEEYGKTDAVSNFEEACISGSDLRLLICLDNLETIISESPEAFDSFNVNLPASWKLIVTSRVPVDSATTISLKALSSGSAAELARSYATKSSGTFLSHAQCEQIATSADCNPLAIKLTVDLVASGKSLPDASATAKSSVVEFSFKNLIESLSEDAVLILECIFATNRVTRTFLMELLGFDTERVGLALRALLRTSLISRLSTGMEEEYALDDMVKDLVRVNSRNISQRAQISRRLAQNKTRVIASYAAQEKVDKYSIEYIDVDTSPGLRELYSRVLNVKTRSRTRNLMKLQELYRSFESLRAANSENASFHRFRAQLCNALGDIQSAVGSYERSLQLSPGDIRVRFALGYLCLTELRDSPRAENIFEELHTEGYSNPRKTSNKFAQDVIAGLLFSYLYQDKFNNILEFTTKWRTAENLMTVMGCFRATAEHRIAQTAPVDTAADVVAQHINNSMQIVDDVVNVSGYPEEIMKTVTHLAYEVLRRMEKEGRGGRYDKYSIHWLNFLKFHFEGARGVSQKFDLEILSTLPRFSALKAHQNPFVGFDFGVVQVSVGKTYTIDIEKLTADGYVRVTVETPDASWNCDRHCHATDNAGVKYFVSKDSLGQKYVEFGEVVRGSILYVKTNSEPDAGRSALRALSTFVESTP